MNKDELVTALLGLDPLSLKEIFARASRGFDQKAEALYDANPEENGLLAQPYSDLADLLETCSQVFENPGDAPVDTPAEVPQVQVATVTAAVTKQVKEAGNNPWGRR